jgi:hypothetical protein
MNTNIGIQPSIQRALRGLAPAYQQVVIGRYERILPILSKLLSTQEIYNRNRTWPGVSPECKAATQLLSGQGRKRMRDIIKAYADEVGEDSGELRALPKIIVGTSTDKNILGYRLNQFRLKTRNFVSVNI